jgi:hypothetical protein
MNHLAHREGHQAHECYSEGTARRAPTLCVFCVPSTDSGHAFAAISSFLRTLRDLRGDMPVSILVAATPRQVLRGEMITVILLCELAEHGPAWRAIGTRQFHRRTE